MYKTLPETSVISVQELVVGRLSCTEKNTYSGSYWVTAVAML
uniref:Uncharacterized protein n=1 Tax=Anguilla anguilla TaxID=7936 RepID=A0A0E9RF09_ANGAN